MDDEDFEAGNLNFYTERATGLIYEVKVFGEAVLVRPASPGFSSVLRRMTTTDFMLEFEEFLGNPTEIRAFLDGFNGVTAIEVN